MSPCAHTCSWGIIIDKGYQDKGAVQGVITTKLKGASLYNWSEGNDDQFLQNCQISPEWAVYDSADYLIPPRVRAVDL